MGGPTALLKQLLLTLVISSCKIADHSELISYTLATGLWKLLTLTKPGDMGHIRSKYGNGMA